MVVIVLVVDECAPWGAECRHVPPKPKPVTYVSYVFVNEHFVSQVEPGDTFATTKEEEWVSKKKTELTTTRQIETRVKRQVVLEDGKVVEDSGPIVTTNTSEDTEKQEHSQTELRKQGGDEVDNAAAIEAGKVSPGEKKIATVGKDWVPVANPDGVVREVKERRVVSREETEEVRETEDIHHLGDITDEDFLAAVHSGTQDLRQVLHEKNENGTVVSTGPRIIHETTKKRKVTDTEDTSAVSSVRPDGKIVTETTRKTEHEEVKDEPLEEGVVVDEKTVENSQRYQKTKDAEFVEYLADGVKIGTEMRYKAETMEGERQGEGLDDHDWDSLSTRMRRNRRQLMGATRTHQPKPKGPEDQAGPPLDRKDALTKKPLDFDEEEETRKAETSKWLEHHFGSESTRSSRDSIDVEEPTHSKSFFNVTIKSQPVRIDPVTPKPYVARVYSPSPEPERVMPVRNGYFQGISEWSERRHEEYRTTSPLNGRTSTPYNGNGFMGTLQRQSKFREDHAPTPPERKRAIERRQRSSQDSRYDSGYRTHSRNEMSRDSHDEPQDEPPPDYSPPPRHSPPELLCTPPPSPPPMPSKKSYQRTRFAPEDPTPTPNHQPSPPPPKQKHGNIIGQSIRKLVGKIRSASAERKAKQRAKRSPSPQTTYQQYNVIDNIPSSRKERERDRSEPVMAQKQQRGHSPVQRYYLGEDPFGGSIYGRENKYDGVKPARSGRRRRDSPEKEARSHSTLGRFSKSTSRLVNDQVDYSRSAQTLPRNIRSEAPRAQKNSTINVSFINTVSPNRPIANGGPAKPARTYKSHLSRSKSFNVHGQTHENNMYKSNPQLHRLEENPIGLKSPGIVSSLTRSTRDLSDVADDYNSRFVRNGYEADNKKVFLKSLKERAPDLYKTLQSDDEETNRRWQSPTAYSTPFKTSRIATYNDMYEPPTRLTPPPAKNTLRRGSNSTDDYSETYHTTTRNDNPKRPSVTDTVQTISKKTLPTKDGRFQTIESTETKSVTRSRFRGEPMTNVKYLENGKLSNTSNGGVIIEVKNYRN